MGDPPRFSAIGTFAGGAVLAVLIAGLLVFLVRATRGDRRRAAGDTALDLAMALWVVVILAVTVVPIRQSGTLPPMGVIPFLDAIRRIGLGESSVPEEAIDIVNNIILFLPLGILAAVRWGRDWRLVFILLVVCLSTAIELTQALQATGRFSSTTDVVTNTIGAAVGFRIGLRFRHDAVDDDIEDPEDDDIEAADTQVP